MDYELEPIEDELEYELEPIEEEESFGKKALKTLGGYAHTARAIAETGAGLATGLAAFPISKGTKWIEYALSGGDLEKAKAAEQRANERIQFQPTTPEAQEAMEQIGKYALDPVFGTLKEMGRLPGESWKSPVMSELGGDVAEIGGPILLGASIKAGKKLRERPPERPTEVIPERPLEEPLREESLKIKTRAERDAFDEAALTDLGKPERIEARDYVLEEIKPDKLTEKPVVETSPEAKAEMPVTEKIVPAPILEAKPELSTKMERVAPEFEPTVESPLPQGPGAKTAGLPDIGEDIVKQRNLGSKKEPLLQPAIKRSEFEAITELKDLPPAVFERGEIGKGAQLFGGVTENPIRTFDKLGAKAKDLFYYPIREAWHGYKSQYKGLVDEMNIVTKGMKKRELENIGAYAISQQKNGLEILTNMGKNAPELTPKEAKAYSWFRDKYEDLYGQLQFAREQAGLDPFGKVENYFTFFREYSTMRDLGFDPLRMAADQFRSVADNIHLKGTVFRFAKERGDWQAPLELNAKNVFSVYSDYATRHINMSPAISKGRELIGTYKIKDAKDIPVPIDEKGQTKFDFATMERVVEETQFSLNETAPRTHQFIEKWLDYSAGQKPATSMPPVIERSLRKLNQNIAFAVLGGNLRSALVQPAALLNTMTELGVRSTAKGIYSLMKGEGSRAMKDSQVLVGRDYDASIQNALEGWSAKAGEVKSKMGAVAMEPLKMLDMMSAKATWLGAYESVKGKMNYRDAVRYADDVVTRTQGSATPFDLSPAQRTTLGKTLSMFQTFVINQWGFVTRDVLGIRNPEVSKMQALKKTTEFIVGAALLNSMYEAAGMNPPLPAPVSTFMKETAKDTPIGEAMFKAALEPTSMLPYLGGARFGYLPFGPVGDLAKQATTMLKESRLPNKREVFEIGGKLAGIPGTSQISKMIKAYERDQTPYEIAVGSPPTPEQYKAYVKKQRKKSVKLREAKKRARY